MLKLDVIKNIMVLILVGNSLDEVHAYVQDNRFLLNIISALLPVLNKSNQITLCTLDVRTNYEVPYNRSTIVFFSFFHETSIEGTFFLFYGTLISSSHNIGQSKDLKNHKRIDPMTSQNYESRDKLSIKMKNKRDRQYLIEQTIKALQKKRNDIIKKSP